MSDYSFLYDDDVSQEDVIAGFQDLINTGAAWSLEGAVGRQAMQYIEAGLCTLGDEGHRDYYGNYVPSKHEVVAGSKGSQRYVDERSQARHC